MINKMISPEQVLAATKRLSQHEIGVKGFFMFGFPAETEAEMEKTKQLAFQMARKGADNIAAFEVHPYPGTLLWQSLKRDKPEVLDELEYIGSNDHDLKGESGAKVAKTSVWLREDVEIAEVPSSITRQYVNSTLEGFYAIVRERYEEETSFHLSQL